jgi:Fe-S-cluster-containing dehydrogenase component/CRP-like cAMP-binding protein
MLRGLDARARTEIEAAGAVRSLRAQDVLFRHGDLADALYVVASGVCTLSGVRRGEDAAVVIRRARTGDVLGEEATVAAFSTRQLEARCEADAVVAEVPLVVFRRAAVRAGGDELMAKVERGLRRAATLDLLRTTSFTRGLADSDIELLLDAAKHVHVARGEHVYREGDVATDAFLVAEGLLQAQTDDEGRPRVEAYLARGDVFGDEELAERTPRVLSVVASGPVWLVAIPRDVFVVVARRNQSRLDASRRLTSLDAAAQRKPPVGMQTTAHVFRDLYRMRVARSLLVIDQDSCIRCGHCAWSCASVHDDGVSRLVRRGDKIVVSDGTVATTKSERETATAPLLVPNSCQHCKNPSCMIDCPTGAIGRDARGEVFIREDLCTGCGSCAKACPWENIQMAPRKVVARDGQSSSGQSNGSQASAYPTVAVKCDLCKGVDGGPACVASCPTQAIARIDPNVALVELRIPGRATAAPRPVLPPRIAAWPWAVGAGLAGVGLATTSPSRFSALRADGPLPERAEPRWTSGILSGLLILLLVGYAVGKRIRGPLAKLRGPLPSLSRWLYVAHLSMGAFAAGVVTMHVGGRVPPNVAGALTITIALAIVTGAFGGVISGFVPRILSRVERKSVLPEELAARPKEIDEKIFATLSGKSELVKTLFIKALRPYRRSLVGPILLVLSGRTLRKEETVLRQRLDALTGGRSSAQHTAGLDDLVRLVVEHRAVRAQRLLTWTLRGWLVPHVATTAAALVLLVLHVVGASR